MGFPKLFMTLLLSMTLAGIEGYPTGAPAFVCDSMVPGHPATTTSGIPPYSINITTKTNGDEVVVHGTLFSTNQSVFRGFMIEQIATDVGYGEMSGNRNSSKTVCGPNNTQGLTHVNNTDKTHVDFTWTSMNSSIGNIQFRATVVESCCSESRFWLNITSNKLNPSSSTPSSAPNTTQTSTSTKAPSGQINYDSDCGVTKGCFSNCTSSGCTFLVTWQSNNNSLEGANDTGSIVFDIRMKLPDTNNQWIAVGISQTGYMDGTNVAACLSQSSRVTLLSSYNDGYSNVLFNDTMLGLSLITGEVSNGIIHCQFTREIQLKTVTEFLDLEQMNYMLVGTGPVVNRGIQKHGRIPVASPDKINFMTNDVEPKMTTGTPPVTKPTSVAPSGQINYDSDCGVSKGCFSNCTSSGCTFLVTWQSNNNNSLEGANYTGSIVFDIRMKLPDTNNQWIAVGISQTGYMDGTNVAACLSQSSGVTLQSSYNDGYSNVLFNDTMLGLSLITGDVSNGIIHCQFTREIQLENVTEFLDLEQMYYMLVGTGPVANGVIQQHGRDPAASPDKINFMTNAVEPKMTTGTPPVTKPTSIAPSGQINYDSDCGVSKGCFSNCTSSGCAFLVTWQSNNNSLEVANDTGNIVFDIKMKLPDTNNQWIAVGVSPTGYMDGTNVAACLSQSSGVTLQSSYNDGYSNVLFNDTMLGLSLITGGLSNGIIHCQFTREIQLENVTEFLDLEQMYYMLVGTGPVVNGVIQKHGKDPVASPDKINFMTNDVEPKMTTGTPPVTNPTSIAPSGQILYDPSCGVSKGCFPDCLNKDCSYLVTWQKNVSNNAKNVVDELRVIFDIKMKLGDTMNKWIAVGISPQGKMKGTNVAACLSMTSGVSLQSSYNSDFANILYTDPLLGLTLIQGDVSNGIIHCKYSRAEKITTDPDFLDLNSTYYLVVASGPVVSGVIKQHTNDPYKSASRVDFLETYVSKEDASGPSALIKLHASLMIIAWLFLSSVGIVAARHCKTILAEKMYFGVKAWFLVHRSAMVLAVLCVIVAFIAIFVEVKGFSKIAAKAGKEYTRSHPYTGIGATALALINPLLAFVRPAPTARNRPLFNWAHYMIGNGAHITAVITIYFGLGLSSAKVHPNAMYVMTGYIVVYVLIYSILEIHRRRNIANSDKEPSMVRYNHNGDGDVPNSQSLEIDDRFGYKSMEEYGSIHRTNSSSALISDLKTTESNFKFYMLVIHALLMMVLATFLVLMVWLHKQMKQLFDS